MNRLSSRIRKMLEDESRRLDQIAYIANEEGFSEGVFLASRLTNLAEINQTMGHTDTDAFLHRLGDVLETFCKGNPHLMAGRLTGTDFAIFSGHPVDSYALSGQIKGLLIKAASLPQTLPELGLPTVASQFRKTEAIEETFKIISNVLTEISVDNPDALHVIGQEDIARQQDNDEAEWHKLLTSALDAKRLKLAYYPVLNTKGLVIHQESPVRMQLKIDEAWLPASEFISWANRLDLVTRIDKLVVEKALEELSNGGDDIGLNISARAICNPDFIQHMVQLIKANPMCAHRLWLEVPEHGAFEHLSEFRTFCNALKPLGCKIGIEHVGAQISRLGELHDLGLDYIKIDISVIRDIDTNTGNQAFLRGLCLIAHSIGLIALAEGVQTADEIAALPELGIDGMTGPGVKTS
jgi:EAL domain-containing protein (putative c-di-GMP-specific phosphodiesterase class I)/GGDEF domain-containing protein